MPSKNEIFFCILPLCMKPLASELSDSFSDEVFSVDLGAEVGFLTALVVVETEDALGFVWLTVELFAGFASSIGLVDFMELFRTSLGSG